MCLFKFLCRHRDLTAISIYEKGSLAHPEIYVVCVCNKCGKEVELPKKEMQLMRHEFRLNVNVDKIVFNKLWGRWE